MYRDTFGTKGPVRLTIPAVVASDLKKLHRTLEGVAERLGCKACFSGADCYFRLERAFVINEKSEIARATLFEPDPDGSPALTARVGLPGNASNDLEKVKSAVAQVAGKLGCDACCSGFDIEFLNERVFLFDEAANLR